MPAGGNFTNCNCRPDVPVCENPTQPVATVGLCLADGTPIATTVVRDCAGNITQEGWLNLTSGAWSAGTPPAGTIACGDSRSITVSGTFCDIDDQGTVVGLVLIEYQYAPDGSIDSVRLVDAVTGDTYTPQGEITTCPAGVEQPERDLVQLCDVSDDESGTVTRIPFVRDYTRNENGQITGHTDYTLDGQPYTVTGEVGQCQAVDSGGSCCPPEPRSDIETQVLCVRDGSGTVVAQVVAERVYDDQTGTLGEQRLTGLDGEPYELPEDAELVLCTGEAAQGPNVQVLVLCDTPPGGEPVPFLRHLVYPAGAATPTVLDTELDGTTPYTVTGTVGVCQPQEEEEEECPSRHVLSACRYDDTDGDGIADTEYVELLAVDCEGALSSVGTYLPDLSGPYTPVSPVDGTTADPGPEPVVTVQAHRVDLTPGGSWDAATVPTLRSVTFTAHGGTGTITTADGTSTLYPGESVTWSVDKEVDAALVGPLSVTAGTGTITVTWTRTA